MRLLFRSIPRWRIVQIWQMQCPLVSSKHRGSRRFADFGAVWTHANIAVVVRFQGLFVRVFEAVVVEFWLVLLETMKLRASRSLQEISTFQIWTVSGPGKVHNRLAIRRIEWIVIAKHNFAILLYWTHSVEIFEAVYWELLFACLFLEIIKLVDLQQQISDSFLLCFVS